MSKFGELDFEQRWYDEPLAKYLDYKKTEHEVTDNRYNELVNVLANSPDSDWEAWDELISWRGGMNIADARSFKKQLEESDDLASRSIEGKLTIVQTFLKELLERKIVKSNPVAYVYEETDFDHDSKNKIERTVDEIGSYLRAIPNLQQRALGTIFGKTGIRIGENLNIDLPFVHLDHPIYYNTLDKHGISVHNEIADYPDTLYVPSEPTIGEVFRGQKRKSGNKRERGTRIPIDAELKRALLDWLAVRPETAYPHPLWVSPNGSGRLGKSNPNEKLTNYWAEKTGLVNNGDTEEFTPHWFRHFFTTNMKPGGNYNDSIAPTLVKYIRGDVEDDIMEVYTHDWGDQVKKKYLDAIYHFGIYD